MLLVWRKHASVFGAASEEVGAYLSVVVETTETTTRCLFAAWTSCKYSLVELLNRSLEALHITHGIMRNLVGAQSPASGDPPPFPSTPESYQQCVDPPSTRTSRPHFSECV